MSLQVLPRQPAQWLALLGGTLLAAAFAWWAIVFLRVLSNGYLSAPEALSCSAISSIVCDLATSLCGKTHPLGITWYSPLPLWAGVALLSAAAFFWRDEA